jgi:L-asparaginase II
MALAYARLVSPAALDPGLQAACRRIVAAMLDYPEVVAGTRERVCTDIMRVCGQAVIAKIGAEGVYTIGVLPNERYPTGLGIAFKVEDGAGRATAPVAVAILDQLGLLEDGQRAQLASWRQKPITNHRGLVVGHLRPAFHLEFL